MVFFLVENKMLIDSCKFRVVISKTLHKPKKVNNTNLMLRVQSILYTQHK